MTDLSTLTASEVAALIARRQVSAREVTTATLARIDARNPALNAIVQHMPDEAMAAADAGGPTGGAPVAGPAGVAATQATPAAPPAATSAPR